MDRKTYRLTEGQADKDLVTIGFDIIPFKVKFDLI